MGRKPTGRPQGRPRNETLDICLVVPCNRVAYARSLCKAHYNSLARALREGRSWDLETGKPVPSGYKPRSPFEQPDFDSSSRYTSDLSPEDIAEVRAQVEVDAARVLPHLLGFCIADMLVRTGLTRNPDAAAAFCESAGVLPVPRNASSAAIGEGSG